MIAMNVQSNVKDFARYLTRVQKKQLPFATANALTKTAEEAQKELQAAMPRTFAVTKKWWMKQQPTGIKIVSAKKKDPTPEAIVYTSAYFAKLQEEGGTKIPFESRGILVPTNLTPKYGRKSGGTGKLIGGAKVLKFKKGAKRKPPGKVASAGAVKKTRRKKRRKKVKRPELVKADPIATMKSGSRGVFRRRGKKRLPIEKVYTYVPRARIRERMRFKARAYHVCLRAFDDQFARALAYALKTAR